MKIWDLTRWSDAHEDNVQVHVEMPPLEDTPIQDPLASRTYVEMTQDQTTQEETQTHRYKKI